MLLKGWRPPGSYQHRRRVGTNIGQPVASGETCADRTKRDVAHSAGAAIDKTVLHDNFERYERFENHNRRMRISLVAIASAATVAVVLSSCARPDRAEGASGGARSAGGANTTSATCPPATGGIVVSFDKVGYFPARAAGSELERLCPAVDDTLYDAVGWQANGRKFPFAGAMLVAIPHQGNSPDSIPGDAPEMWTAAGDSVRLPDGQRIPKTLGALRKFGKLVVDKNEGYDDWNGPDARSCRYPDILFKLNGDGLPKMLPDSARVTSIEINVRRHEREWEEMFCRR